MSKANKKKPELEISELSNVPTPAKGVPKIDLRGNSLAKAGPKTKKLSADKKQAVTNELADFKKKQRWRNVRFAVVAFVVFALVFNYQVIYSQFLFFFNKPSTQQSKQVNPTPTPTQTTNAPAQAQLTTPENVIIIPKINVRAPLVFPDSINEAVVLKALESGVAHYAGTANPGDVGNAVFFGHSSNDWWQPGNYKYVFVLLEKLAPGDTYQINYNSRKYIYTVTSTKIVEPTDLSVLKQTAEPTSTLITCTPPGTSWKRFIVSAKQTEPAPAATQDKTTSPAEQNTASQPPANTVLPSAAPSIWSQISDFFAKLWNTVTGRKPQPAAQTETSVPPAKAQQQRLPEVQ
ncbi:sortase [Candidatus Saccharibacteria bacterium]|nr:sortase [Candidatus Saccharibacteria bacterium]